MRHILSVYVIIFTTLYSFSQNIGINSESPDAALDINGDLILRTDSLLLFNGDNDSIDLNLSKFSNYVIIGPTNSFNIGGIVGGKDGKLIHLYNHTNYAMNIKHHSLGALAINQIHTGLGTDYLLNSFSSASLQYLAIDSSWHILSKHNEVNPPSSTFWNALADDIINTNSGNVGIGTTPIHTRLEINGSVGSSVAMFGVNKCGVNISADNPEIGFNYFYNNGTKTIKAGFASVLGMYPSNGNVYLGNFNGNQSTENFGNINGFQEVLSITQNGKVGIKETIPLQELSVLGSSPMINNGSGPNPLTSGGLLRLHNNSNKTIMNFDGNVIQSEIYNVSPNGTFGTSLYLNPYGGSVAIGTLNASGFKLSVNGSIRAKEIQVLTGWADYVFADGYKLKTLTETEKYIKEHKHLPDLPSQKFIEENGLNVGEIQKLMMAKIEELTLYIIEQEKKITALEKKLIKNTNK